MAGTPEYLERRGRPLRPRDLLEHDCINYRQPSTGTLYAWEFEHRGREQAISVRGRVTANDGATLLCAALNGLGLVYLPEQTLMAHVQRGALQLVLEDHAVTVPGFFLYFPRQSAQQPKLRAFIDTARRLLPSSPRQAGARAGRGKRRSSSDRQLK